MAATVAPGALPALTPDTGRLRLPAAKRNKDQDGVTE